MSYDMLWKLRVQPEDADEIATMAWPDDSSAPTMRSILGHGEVWSWYRSEEDLLDLSERLPGLLFIVDVVNAEEPGASPPERWYFKAGSFYKSTATIVYDDFDPAKLVLSPKPA